MHRNTYLVVTFLAVFAALVVGVNLGKRLSPAAGPTPTPLPTISLAPTPTTATYTNEACGFSFTYPTTLTLTDNATSGALLVHTTDKDQSVAVACEEEIPRPPLTADRIESLLIYNEAKTASVSARLYHDASVKDGTLLDELIFQNPRTGMDIFIAGFGEIFDSVIATIKLLP